MNFTLENIPKHKDGSYKIDPSDGRALLKASSNSKKLLHPNIKKKGDQQTIFFLMQTFATISLTGYGAAIENLETLNTGIKNTGKNLVGFLSKYLTNVKKDSAFGKGLNSIGCTTNNIQSLVHGIGIWSNSPQAFGNLELKNFPDLFDDNAPEKIEEARTGYSAVAMYSALTPTPLMQFNTNATFLETDYNKRIMKEAFLNYAEEKKIQLIEHYGCEDNIPIVKAMVNDSNKREIRANSFRIGKNIALLIGGLFGTLRGIAFQGRNSVNQMADAIETQKDNLVIFGTALGILAGAIFTFSAAKVAHGAFTKKENKKPKLSEINRDLDQDDIKAVMEAFDQELSCLIEEKSFETNSKPKDLKL